MDLMEGLAAGLTEKNGEPLVAIHVVVEVETRVHEELSHGINSLTAAVKS